MRCLITGFEPQFGIKKTPSGELAKLWADGMLSVPGVEVMAKVLPQVFGVAARDTCADIASFRPNIVIMYGATQKNDPIRLERFAVNVRNSAMGDNTMVPVRDQPVVFGGVPGYEASWPCAGLAEALTASGNKSVVSYHAGTHVCNDQFYTVMKWLSENDVGHPVAAGFVHMSFPNEFGVVEDRNWETSGFPGIVDASVKLVSIASDWYSKSGGRP
jgi:pyroglutamyl-peptidase